MGSETKKFYYRVYGLNLESEIYIPEFTVIKSPSKKNIDATIKYKTVSKEIKETIKFDEVIKLKNILPSRNAYKKLGKDPSRYRLSSESLVKRVVKGNDLYIVNNIVDINNLISLHTCYSVGTYDLDKVKGSITFTVGEENERYDGIGRGSINLENLPVFEDEDGKFGSTTSDSIKAMITNDTTHILMNIIAFEEDENLERYIEYSKKLLERFADATIIDTKITKCK